MQFAKIFLFFANFSINFYVSQTSGIFFQLFDFFPNSYFFFLGPTEVFPTFRHFSRRRNVFLGPTNFFSVFNDFHNFLFTLLIIFTCTIFISATKKFFFSFQSFLVFFWIRIFFATFRYFSQHSYLFWGPAIFSWFS